MKFFILLFLLIGLSISQSCINCPLSQCINNKCLSCNPGFFIDNTNVCGRYTPIEGCKIYNQINGGCFQCFPGKLLQNDICQQLIENCNYTITNNTEICTVCNDTYVLIDQINCYSSDIQNCKLGSLPRKQIDKLTGKQIQYCQLFEIQKCSKTDANVNYCNQCLPGYFNLNGVCHKLINQIQCPFNSCQCKFYYYKNTCYQFQIQGCLSSKDNLFCDLCADNFIAVRGKCFQPIKYSDIHCNLLQLNSDICKGCNFQYLLDPNYICVKSNNVCDNLNQAKCQVLCNSLGLLYYNDQCYLRDSLCIAFDKTLKKCTKCSEGYTLNENAVCDKIQKCQKYLTISGNIICQKCFTGYQLNSTTLKCDTLPYNCRVMTNTNRCTTCSNFTELFAQNIPTSLKFPSNLSIAVNTTVCIYTTQNCLYYNIFGFCQICRDGFVQKNHQCVSVANNCLIQSVTDKSKCQVCQNGYQLDSILLSCFPKIQGCLDYTTNTNETIKSCTRCNQKYILRNGICFSKNANCIQFSVNGNCLRCANNLIPFYNQCVFFDVYALSYDQNGIANKYMTGFIRNQNFSPSMRTNYQSYVSTVRNIPATNFGTGPTSQFIAFGGIYNSQGIMRVLPTTGLFNQRIAQYNINGKIRSCRIGYTLLNDTCVVRTDFCKQYSSSTGLCVRCNGFYHMGAGRKCLPFSAQICLTQLGTGEFCGKCSVNYTLINGQCYYSKLNLIDVGSSSGSTISVQQGYFLYKKFQVAWPLDQNCISQQQPGQCLQCIDQSQFIVKGMRKINGKCIVVQDNCQTYNSRGLCQICNSGYILYYKQCFPNNCLTTAVIDKVCVTCPFILTYEAGLCVNKPQNNALVYQPIINFTTSIKNATIKFCTAGYYLKSDLSCQKMISFCQVTNPQTGRCTQCSFGYILYEQQCIKQIIGCSLYNRASLYQNCTTCQTNYFLIANKCYTLPFRCLALDSKGFCAKCLTGYTAIVQNGESICVFIVNNCATYSRTGRCSECATNYVLQNNACNFYLPGCNQTITDRITNRKSCKTCLPGFIMMNGFCINDLSCKTLDSNGRCIQCIAGFRLVNGMCIKNTITDCVVQKDQDCLECASGFVKLTVYGKVYCILRRIAYSGCTKEQYPCVSGCTLGFNLRDDGFCYAQKCLEGTALIDRFSMRQCTKCYPYYKFNPTKRFCILFNCNPLSTNNEIPSTCYERISSTNSSSTQTVPQGFFLSSRTSQFIIEIKHCLKLADDYSCLKCTDYRYPNLMTQWNLCYPNNCKNIILFDCNVSSNGENQCMQYFSNNLLNDKTVCVADKCQIYNKDGTCNLCIIPYNLTNNGVCVYQGPCQIFDTKFSIMSNNCLQCKKQYYLQNGKCIVNNCTKFNSEQSFQCLQCAPGFELTKDKTCQLKFCVYPNQNYPCQQCIQGYYWNQVSKLCQLKNCKVFNYLTSKCQTCENFFIFNSSTLKCIPIECKSYDYINEKCLQCAVGYKFSTQGLCILQNCCNYNTLIRSCTQCCEGYDYINGSCATRCSNFNSFGVCISCKPGYKLDSQNMICIAEQLGCIEYRGSQCIKCQVGLMLFTNSTGSNICIPKYCNKFSQISSIQCIECMPRFNKLTSGLCYPKNCINFDNFQWQCLQCDSTPTFKFNIINSQGLCLTQFCRSYNLQTYVCNQCLSTTTVSYQLQYINSSQVCLPSCGQYQQLVNFQCQYKYCSVFTQNFKCQQCIQGYQLQPLTGYCKIKFCAIYNDVNENCLSCKNGFMLEQINNKYCVPINCKTYNIGSQICSECIEGYVKDYNTCVLKDCVQFNNLFICQKCIDGFNLMIVNNLAVCQRIFNSTCKDGLYFSTVRGQCIPIPVNFCLYVNPSIPDFCLSCMNGYFLRNGICYSTEGCSNNQISFINGCKQCIQGFKLEGNMCKRDFCQEYFSNNTCRICTTGYFLVNNQCVSYLDFCLNGNVNSGCLTCQNGYQAVGGFCKKIPEFCQRIDNLLKCVQCIPGYILSPTNKLCYRQIQNCMVQSGDICLRCMTTAYQLSFDQKTCTFKQPIRYCLQHDSTFDFCLVCQQSYSLTPDRKCLADNCGKYDLQTYQCIQCANNTISGVNYYYVLKNQKCQSINIKYCLVPADETKCRICLQGYVLNNGQCRVDNCMMYNSNQIDCTSCLNGFYLTQNKTCRRKPDACQVVNIVNNLCNVCVSGYTLSSNGLCFRSIDFCDNYDFSSGLCLNCRVGYYLTTAKICMKLPDNCQIANQFGQCQQCSLNYALSSISNICYKLVNNCTLYNDFGICITCINGFYLNTNSICIILPQNCIISNSLGVCRQCADKYRISNGICVFSIENCLVYQNNNCISCNQNYYLFNYICYKLPDRCLTLNDKMQCTKCQVNFSLYQKQCYQTIQNCTIYSLSGFCLSCDNGYFINLQGRCDKIPNNCNKVNVNGFCVQCLNSTFTLQNGICYKIVENCFAYQLSTSICKQCIAGFYLFNNNCYKLQPNCLSVNSNSECISCVNGYTLQNGTCIINIPNCLSVNSNGLCTNCSAGYYISPTSQRCIMFPQGCSRMSLIFTGCISCIQGYSLQNGICYKTVLNCFTYNISTNLCRQCLINYFLLNLQCLQLPPNCQSLNSQRICSSCKQGFILIGDNKCVKTISNCLNYSLMANENVMCLQCETGYYLTNLQQSCSLLPNNCLQVTFSPLAVSSLTTLNTVINDNICTKCAPNYLLQNGICYKQDKNCQSYDPNLLICKNCLLKYYLNFQYICTLIPIQNCQFTDPFGTCLSCITGYVLSEGICYLNISFCSVYNPNNKLCQSCINGFILQNGYCYRFIQNCLNYKQETGNCVRCRDSFALNSNGLCFICSDGSYIDSQGQCRQNPLNCRFANQLGQCVNCLSTYTLISGLCYNQIQFCQNYSIFNNQAICRFCSQGYYLKDQFTCVKLPNFCSSVNPSTGVCLQCINGYLLNSNGICYLNVPNCKTYQLSTGICLQCIPNFFLNNNRLCQRILDQNCLSANSLGQCLFCIDGFWINNGICIKNVTNCLKYNSLGCIQCNNLFYLQNGICFKFPDFCQSFDSNTLFRCLKCISGYTLTQNGICTLNTNINCLYINPSNINQCLTCKNTFYEYWLNPNTLTPFSSNTYTSPDQYCKSYSDLCTNVDLLGNCISCCFGSKLQNGKCVGTMQRSLNCESFDQVNFRCLKCIVGYVYCESSAICVESNINCLVFNSTIQQCILCAQGLTLFNGECIKKPPGVSATNDQICNTGYTYSSINDYGVNGNSCFRNKNQLRRISTMSGVSYQGTSLSPSNIFNFMAQLLNSPTWVPPNYLNNYLSINFQSPQIIHYIQIQGNNLGYVTDYILHYKNKQGAPLICWNSCQIIKGSTTNKQTNQLRLAYPIISTQIRFYPLRWTGGIVMNVDMLVEIQ